MKKFSEMNKEERKKYYIGWATNFLIRATGENFSYNTTTGKIEGDKEGHEIAARTEEQAQAARDTALIILQILGEQEQFKTPGDIEK